MAVISKQSCWISSTVSKAQETVRNQVNSIVHRCSRNISTLVHPKGFAGASGGSCCKPESTPEEFRQWHTFEYADLMEQGLAVGLVGSFLECPVKDVHATVDCSPDEREFFLTTPDESHALLARVQDNGEGFNIYLANGDPPQAFGPAFTLTCNSSKTKWILQAERCYKCQCLGRRSCGKQEVAVIHHYMEDIGPGEICFMDMAIPFDDAGDVWCPVCIPEGSREDTVDLTSIRPVWNEEEQQMEMEFFDRCSEPSERNFQLGSIDNPEKPKLIFGKVAANQFALDFKRPLNTVQAFAAALTSFAMD